MRTLLTAALAAFVLAGAAVPASAASLTGEDIFNDTTVSFPSRTPTLVGTSIVYAAVGAGPGGEKLFRLPILAAGAVSNTGGPTSVTFSANLTYPSASPPASGGGFDHDPGIYITDGTYAVGVLYGDNGGGRIWLSDGTDSAGAALTGLSYDALTVGGFPTTLGTAFTFSGEFVLGPTSSAVTGTANSASHDLSFAALDRSAGLSVLFVADGRNEPGQLNTLEFSITTVPEPGSLPLMLLGGAGLALLRRRRRAARA